MFAWTFGHCSRATNNAMELLAVIEALSALPDGSDVWASTDSCYVKRGITEWLPGWIARKWKNSQGAQVANRSLWEKLVTESNRMATVRWSWVKAHAGYLLNECADMLATKGVRNETPPVRVQYLHPINEDTDTTEYTFRDNELPTPPSDWTGESMPPEGALYTVGKLNLSSAPQIVPQTVPQTVPGLPATSPFAVVLSDSSDSDIAISDEESSNPWPAPATTPDSADEKGKAQLFPTIASLPTPAPTPEVQERPQWWTEAWDMLEGIESEDQRKGYLRPVDGVHFLARCESDIHEIDNYCSRTVVEASGAERLAQEADDMHQTVCGAIWSDEVITLSATCGKGVDPNERFLHHLKCILQLVPNGRGITLHTSSEFLLEEGEKFRQWVQSGQIAQAYSQMHSAWRNILGHMENQGKLIAIVRQEAGEFPQQEAALRKSCQERIEKMERCEREGWPDPDPTEPSWP
jgi:ribonuclease HI